MESANDRLITIWNTEHGRNEIVSKDVFNHQNVFLFSLQSIKKMKNRQRVACTQCNNKASVSIQLPTLIIILQLLLVVKVPYIHNINHISSQILKLCTICLILVLKRTSIQYISLITQMGREDWSSKCQRHQNLQNQQ